MADINPCPAENLLHFELEYFRIEIERAVNVVAMNQRLDRLWPHSHSPAGIAAGCAVTSRGKARRLNHTDPIGTNG
jgi:hypothetical protein